MKIYVFGNQDLPNDSKAIKLIPQLARDFPQVQFVVVKPNEDLPFINDPNVIIFDVVMGIDKPVLFTEKNLDSINLPPRNSTHDFDLGFQLRYLKKLGKLGEITILGIPYDSAIDYSLIHSTFKKLVEHDIHGS
jgi:hypothetical protein